MRDREEFGGGGVTSPARIPRKHARASTPDIKQSHATDSKEADGRTDGRIQLVSGRHRRRRFDHRRSFCASAGRRHER